MPKTVGVSRAAAKYQSRTAVAGGDYVTGIGAPKRSWSAAAQEASANYVAGVTSGDIGARFSAGVSKAGDSKWSAMARAKGATRYSPGVVAGLPYYTAGMTDVLGTIEGISWTRPGPAGSPGNYAIVTQIGDALHAMKVGRT